MTHPQSPNSICHRWSFFFQNPEVYKIRRKNLQKELSKVWTIQPDIIEFCFGELCLVLLTKTSKDLLLSLRKCWQVLLSCCMTTLKTLESHCFCTLSFRYHLVHRPWCSIAESSSQKLAVPMLHVGFILNVSPLQNPQTRFNHTNVAVGFSLAHQYCSPRILLLLFPKVIHNKPIHTNIAVTVSSHRN
jgi:hypothetical protein